jgi:5-methyltetrahydropteroyltriglutamate--homocysteine methyltransferase
MKRSTNRILTTHTGSLARPVELLDAMTAMEQGKPYDQDAYAGQLRTAVAEIVRKQVECGLDVIDDGEMGKPSFLTYINQRLSGSEPGKAGPGGSPWARSREAASFPEFYNTASHAASAVVRMVCTGPITYKGHAALRRDIENLKAAISGVSAEDVFMPAISPSNIAGWQRNEYYRTNEEYLFAIAGAMQEEYKAIIDAGFVVQIDDPELVTYYVTHPALSIEQCRQRAEVSVEALNHALRGIPEEKVRFHTCYGINMGPRVHDMEMKDMADIMLKVNAGAYSFEAANPRHEHEWRIWENLKLPEGKSIIPGVITHTSVLVEHPELVAQRIERFAKVVGRENVIAGADCGFATFASTVQEIHPTVVWAKFKSLAEGARIATKRLWGGA